jgi:hypothetical protein
VADWRVVDFTGRTLAALLQRRIGVEMQGNQVQVQIITPHVFGDLGSTTQPVVSLFLYRIIENAEMRNQRQRMLSDGTLVRESLPLELCYLVTAWGAHTATMTDELAVQEEHQLLGIVMQTFYDNAEIGRAHLVDDTPSLWSPTDSIQVVMESLGVEDHYRIWDSSKLPYRLSLTYRVRVMALDSATNVRPVRAVQAAFGLQGHV